MLRPKVIQETIHQLNMDRNLNLSVETTAILADEINRLFRLAETPAKNKEKLDVRIKEHRDAVTKLLSERRDLSIDCEHVWLRQMYSDSPFFCQACGDEV